MTCLAEEVTLILTVTCLFQNTQRLCKRAAQIFIKRDLISKSYMMKVKEKYQVKQFRKMAG
jgi:hypothetical protein